MPRERWGWSSRAGTLATLDAVDGYAGLPMSGGRRHAASFEDERMTTLVKA
jgi:hypothetical protein